MRTFFSSNLVLNSLLGVRIIVAGRLLRIHRSRSEA